MPLPPVVVAAAADDGVVVVVAVAVPPCIFMFDMLSDMSCQPAALRVVPPKRRSPTHSRRANSVH